MVSAHAASIGDALLAVPLHCAAGLYAEAVAALQVRLCSQLPHLGSAPALPGWPVCGGGHCVAVVNSCHGCFMVGCVMI